MRKLLSKSAIGRTLAVMMAVTVAFTNISYAAQVVETADTTAPYSVSEEEPTPMISVDDTTDDAGEDPMPSEMVEDTVKENDSEESNDANDEFVSGAEEETDHSEAISDVEAPSNGGDEMLAEAEEESKRAINSSESSDELVSETDEIIKVGDNSVEIREADEETKDVVLETEIPAESVGTSDTNVTASTESQTDIESDEDVVASGTCGENAVWVLTEIENDLILTISGSGSMKNYDYSSDVPWYEYADQINTVIVEDNISSIGNCAFSGCSILNNVTLPASLRSIGEWGFSWCTSLESITLPENVDRLEIGAFKGCKSLRSIGLSVGMTDIGDVAFEYCESLSEVLIPDNVLSIGINAFCGCAELSSVILPERLVSIGEYAFNGCKALIVYTGSNCEFLSNVQCGESWLDQCQLQYAKGSDHEFDAPEVSIDGNTATAVFKCTHCGHGYKLKFVIDGDKCAISELVSADVSEIIMPDSIGEYKVINILSNAFAFQERITSVIIPEGIESIGFFAFSCCYGLTDITLPKSLKSIGAEAFANCTGLTEVTVQTGLEKIGERAFSGCENLEKINLPEGLTDIGKYAFSECSSLVSIDLPESLIGISDSIFYNCSSLRTVTMSTQVTTIGGGAFYGCRSLSDITLPPRVMSIGAGAFMYCSSLTDFTIPMNTTRLRSGVLADCTGLKSIVITRNVMNIEENAVGMYYSEVYETYRPIEGFTIYGYEGSPAEEYANKNSIKFVALAPVTGISLNVSSTTVSVGGSVTLVPTISPANAGNKNVSWQSSNTKIATVDKNGVVRGIKPGTATITVKTDDYGKTAKCTVQVLFTDVPASGVYYSDSVYWAAGKGITAGYSDGSFGVGRDCQRREVMIFLWRYAGQPTGHGDARTLFNDMGAYGPDSAANKAVAWAYKTGIAKGYSDGGFHPTDSIVRKDVMIMMYRLAGKPAVSGTLAFPDCQKYSKSSDTYRAILWGSKNGITNGYNSGEYAGQFGDKLNCLREQIVTFLKRYDNKKGNWKK